METVETNELEQAINAEKVSVWSENVIESRNSNLGFRLRLNPRTGSASINGATIVAKNITVTEVDDMINTLTAFRHQVRHQILTRNN